VEVTEVVGRVHGVDVAPSAPPPLYYYGWMGITG
jgi:hypothetical protein